MRSINAHIRRRYIGESARRGEKLNSPGKIYVMEGLMIIVAKRKKVKERKKKEKEEKNKNWKLDEARALKERENESHLITRYVLRVCVCPVRVEER